MMATLGFLRRDFEVFAIKDVDARLAKIDELVTPRLMALVAKFKWSKRWRVVTRRPLWCDVTRKYPSRLCLLRGDP